MWLLSGFKTYCNLDLNFTVFLRITFFWPLLIFCPVHPGFLLWCTVPLWRVAPVSPRQDCNSACSPQPPSTATRRFLPPGGAVRGPGCPHHPQEPPGGRLSGGGGDPHPRDLLPLHLHRGLAEGGQRWPSQYPTVSLSAVNRDRKSVV